MDISMEVTCILDSTAIYLTVFQTFRVEATFSPSESEEDDEAVEGWSGTATKLPNETL